MTPRRSAGPQGFLTCHSYSGGVSLRPHGRTAANAKGLGARSGRKPRPEAVRSTKRRGRKHGDGAQSRQFADLRPPQSLELIRYLGTLGPQLRLGLSCPKLELHSRARRPSALRRPRLGTRAQAAPPMSQRRRGRELSALWQRRQPHTSAGELGVAASQGSQDACHHPEPPSARPLAPSSPAVRHPELVQRIFDVRLVSWPTKHAARRPGSIPLVSPSSRACAPAGRPSAAAASQLAPPVDGYETRSYTRGRGASFGRPCLPQQPRLAPLVRFASPLVCACPPPLGRKDGPNPGRSPGGRQAAHPTPFPRGLRLQLLQPRQGGRWPRLASPCDAVTGRGALSAAQRKGDLGQPAVRPAPRQAYGWLCPRHACWEGLHCGRIAGGRLARCAGPP